MAKKESVDVSEVKETGNSLILTTDKEKLQQQLREALAKIDERIEELSGGTATKSIASLPGNIPIDEWNANSNIQWQITTDIGTLIKLQARLIAARDEYNNAAEEIGLKRFPTMLWAGTDIDTLIKGVAARIKVVNNSTTINTLKAEKRKLETFLSEEDRLATTLANIGNLLK